MGYMLPGGRFKRYGDSLINADTQSALISVPTVKPISGRSLTGAQSRIATSKSVTAAAEISRTAPTFNDPRYTFTTLSIPTDLRTLNGLYRFFDDTDPVVGNAIRLHCLPAGEPVLTRNGIKTIENIVPGDDVINRDGDYQKVLDAFSSNYSGDLYTITATGCPSLVCTDEHRILTCGQIRIQTRKDSSHKAPTKKLEWKPAKALKVGDYVVFPKYSSCYIELGGPLEDCIDLVDFVVEDRQGPKKGKVYKITQSKIKGLMGKKTEYPRFIPVNEEFAELSGWYVAEGYVAQNNKSIGLRFALGKHEPENIARVKYLVKTLFGITAKVRDASSPNAVEIFVGSAAIARMFGTLFGRGAHNKKISENILHGSTEVVKAFLRAYIAGDGHATQYDYTAVTVSQTLAYQLKILGTRIGLLFNFRVINNRHVVKPEYAFRITKRVASSVLYGKKISQKSHPLYTHEDDKFFYIPVRKITTKAFEGVVYDITTEDGTFLQNFIIHNCEFPLSRVSLKDIGDPVIQNHYEDMWNRIRMDKLLFDIALEYWRIGNVFPYGAWNVDDMMWEQFVILNPDYVTVEGTYLNQRPFIKLQPDEHLKKIVTTGQPKFLYDQLPPAIVKYVRMGQEIPLSPQNVFHVAHNKSPYETLGRSIIKRILKSLIYEDRMSMANFAIATRQTIPITIVKVGDPNSGWVPNSDELEEVQELLAAREIDPNFCYDEKTECLTDEGWVKYTDLTYEHKIASFNPDGNKLEYHYPQAITIQDYDDDMIHFKSRKVDCKVTPNHRMWVKRDGEWQVVHAKDVVETDVFRNCVDDYESIPLPDTLKIAGEKVDTGDFFEFIGWYISEGSISGCGHPDKNYRVQITQTQKGSFASVEKLMKKLPWKWSLQGECQFTIHNKALGDYLEREFGKGSNKKKLPRWVLDASPQYLERLFTAYIDGDGTAVKTKRGVFYQAHTASKDLADALQEIGIKLGYAVSLVSRQPKYYRHRDTNEKIYKKADGSDFFLLHRLNFSIDDTSRFPKLKRRKDYNTPFKQELALVGEISRKGKRIDWANVDLFSILKQTEGYAPQAAKLLDCSVGTVLNQMDKLGIEPQKVGTRVSKYAETGNIQRVPYKGKIWCVSVPSGIIITRRRGYPMVAGQTIIYHWGIDIQFYGASGKIWNLTNEFNRILKWKMLGLGISEAILTGGSSYATVYAQLEVLRQRYLHFQHTLQNFVYKGIFEPVAHACGFYKTDVTVAGKYYSGKKYGTPGGGPGDSSDEVNEIFKNHSANFDNLDNQEYLANLLKKYATKQDERALVYPELDWDLLSLSNDVQYRNFLMNLNRLFPGQRKISDSTFYMTAKLDKDSERVKLMNEHEENLRDQLKKAEITEKYRKEFADKGLPFPMEGPGAQQQPGAGGVGGGAPMPGAGTSPGPGGMTLPPGQPPPVGGTGGGNLMGTPATPNAPIGQGAFTGAGGGKTPGVPRSPEAARIKSMELHRSLSRSSAQLEEELAEEVTQLRKLNAENGIDIDKIDEEVKVNVESEENTQDIE